MKKAVIYSDGSFYKNKAGFGAVILENGTRVHEISGSVTDPALMKHRQVTGELTAVTQSLSWCLDNGYTEAVIHYDYLGIQYWADGTWKAKTEMTRKYAEFMSHISLAVHFVKVKAHSGDTYNDIADRLAKAGCGMPDTAPKKPQKTGTAPASILKDEAERAAADIMAALIEEGLLCNYGGYVNNMFARIEILDEGKRCGMIDLYNTKKKRLKPDLRGFKSEMIQSKTEEIAAKIIQTY